MNKKTVRDISPAGCRVLMRVDFNVPLDENCRVTSDKRIRAAVPTIEYIISRGGRLVLMSLLGRPKGERVTKMSLKPCVEVLSGLIGKPVKFSEDCVGELARKAVAELKSKVSSKITIDKPKDYEPLRSDRKKIPPPTKAELAEIRGCIRKKMQEQFGPYGGIWRIEKVVV